MKLSRSNKAVLNTITAAIYEVVHLVCTIVLTRIILASFGSAYNGITSSARQFLQATQILTLGVAGATRVVLYQSLARDDIEKTSGIVRATELYMRKVGFVLIIFTGILTIVYPFVVETGYSWMEVAPLIIAAGLSSAGAYLFGTAYRSLATADQCGYVSNIFGMIAIVLNFVVSISLIKAGCNIQIVRLGASVVLMLNPLLLSIYVKRKYKLNLKCKPDSSGLSLRKDVMATSIANLVHDNTDIIILTFFCDIKIVSVYTIYHLVMNALKKTQHIFTNGTEAIFGNMWAKKETAKIRIFLESYEYIISFFASVVFPTAGIMILPFVSLYTKGVHDVEYILPVYAIIITLAQMLFSIRAPYLTLVQGVGHYRQNKYGSYAEAIINILLSMILVQFIGISGVAIGTLAANIFRTVQYALYIDKNLIHRGKMVFIKHILWALGNATIIYLLCCYLPLSFGYNGWFQWILSTAIVFVISCIITLLSSLLFYREDMKSAYELARKSIRIKR